MASIIPLRGGFRIMKAAPSMKHWTRRPLECFVAAHDGVSLRFFSSSGGPPPGGPDDRGALPFRPRRRPARNYRPMPDPEERTGKKKKGPNPFSVSPQEDVYPLGSNTDADDPLDAEFGPIAANAIRSSRKDYKELEEGTFDDNIETQLRMADYMTSEPGTTEDLVGERRALAMGSWDHEDRDGFLNEVDDLIEEERINQMELGDDDVEREGIEDMPDVQDEVNPNQMAHGPWGETVVEVSRVQKVQRGGTMVRYRALVVGGNTNGCAGFGVGKANSPNEATAAASRMCKRNIFFIDRYQGTGLTRDLAGRNNSCRVILRAVSPNYGLRGHPLIQEILVYLGVTDCSAKSHGNRNVFNVVRATFKAIRTHESMEEIALKRGKRLFNLERVKRLQI